MSGLEDGTFDPSESAERLAGQNRDQIPDFSLPNRHRISSSHERDTSLESARTAIVEQYNLLVSIALCEHAATFSTGVDPEPLSDQSPHYEQLRRFVETEMNQFVDLHQIFTDANLTIGGETFLVNDEMTRYSHLSPGYTVSGRYGSMAIMPSPKQIERDEYFAYRRGQRDEPEYRPFEPLGLGMRLHDDSLEPGELKPNGKIVFVHYTDGVSLQQAHS